MVKTTIAYVCNECGYDSPGFLGKCPECGMWNTFKEFTSRIRTTSKRKTVDSTTRSTEPKKLSDVSHQGKKRIPTGFSELDTVLGGGIVGGSVVLIAGDPGVGKSTLLLQVAMHVARQGKTVLYVSAEESEEQVKLRSLRLSLKIDPNVLIFSSTDTDAITEVIEKHAPFCVIVDSIQTIESPQLEGLAGSVAQVRYGTFSLTKCAKTRNVPIFIVGHVTKEGFVAGPMMLSHMVDVVLFLEGEKTARTRILRSFKNRFGPIDEVGVFSMEEGGFVQVSNPYLLFSSQNDKKISGSSFAVTMEGTRPFVVEIQSLVISSRFPMPRRVTGGIDPRRLEILLAVLQKHCRFPLDTMDVFVNIVGGLKLSDPATDLSVCLAIVSSMYNRVLGNTIGIAEVGLLGELRSVSEFEKRIKEAKTRGFFSVISAKTHKSIEDVVKTLRSKA